jgi:hypothetical protein
MRLLRWLSWTAVATPLVLLLCHEWFGPDIWYHLYLGGRVARTLSAQPADRLLLHQPGFINLYWLFQLVVRGAYALGGIYPVSLLFIAVWGAALAVWLRTSGAFRLGGAGPWLALLAILVCQVRFEQRPEIFSYFFLALQIHWLAAWKMDRAPSRWALTRFTVVEVLWANMHGYFAFGPLLIGLKLAANAASGETGHGMRRPPGQPGLWRLLGLTLLASIASPFGLRNWREVAALWHFFGVMHHQIQEFLPPGERPQIDLWSIRLFWACWLALLAAGIWLARVAGRRELFALLLAAVGLYLSTEAVRNIPLAVFFAAPLLGAVLPRLRCSAEAGGNAREGCARLALILTGAAFSLWIVGGGFHRFARSPGKFGIRESTLAYPVFFTDYVRSTGFSGAVFNSGRDGGYLEFHLPGIRPYADSRYTDPELIAEYFRATRRPADFRQLGPQVAFDGVLLPIVDSREVIVSLLRDPKWRLAYADPGRAFLANLETGAGAAAAVREPLFYRGEDLSVPDYAVSAIEWVSVLAQVNDRDNLLRALRQFADARRVPSGLIEVALDHGLKSSDGEVVAAARALYPKMISLHPIDQETVDWLLSRPPP